MQHYFLPVFLQLMVNKDVYTYKSSQVKRARRGLPAIAEHIVLIFRAQG